jgi:predicted MFS family arabinose efflux permease
LLPLVARERLAGGAQLYGLLVACIGIGAVTGAQFLPRMRELIGADRVVAAGTIGTSAVMITFAVVRSPAIAGLASLLAGATWIAVLSTLNVSAQLLLPDWVRARGLAFYNTVFYGSLALGSVCWGQLAELTSLSVSLLTAATGALLSMGLTRRFRLRG